MKRYLFVILSVVLFAAQGYSQDNQPPSDQNTPKAAAEASAPAPAPVAAEKAAQPKEESIYGEVKSINTAANSITIQYYDYDNDQEKSMEITTDANTKIENAATINDIKQGNWADITYSLTDGKNMAKLITLEKEEAPAETAEPEEKNQQ